MTDSPTPPVPTAKPSFFRRWMILIAIAIGLVLGTGAFFAGQVAIRVLAWVASASQAETIDEPRSDEGDDEGDDTGVLQTYTSEAEGYSIEAPGEGRVSTHEGQNHTSNQTEWGPGYYFVSSTDVSALAIPDTDLPRIFMSSVNGMVEAEPGATVRETESVTIDGEIALTGIIDRPGDSSGMRFVVTAHNDVHYLILVDEFDDGRDENFIASFAFLD